MNDDRGAGRTALAAIPSALDRFETLRARLDGKRPAIFLDYDGTLTPIVEHPEMAVLSEAARRVVAALADKLPVAVISGRDRENVEAKVALGNLVYAGSHGFDIRVPGGGRIGHEVGAEFTPLLDRAEARLHERVDPIPGALVERKRFSIATHWRKVDPARAAEVADAVAAVAADMPELRVKPGKMVLEMQPALDWDKGKAVLWLLAELGLDQPDVVPMFFGDDVTDEDAFRALQGRGIGVIVASPAETARTTWADFRVDDVDQAVALLQRLTPA